MSVWAHSGDMSGQKHRFFPTPVPLSCGPRRGPIPVPHISQTLSQTQGPCTLTLGPGKEQQGRQAHDQGAQQQDRASAPAVPGQQQEHHGYCLQASTQEVGLIEGGLTGGEAAEEAGSDASADQPGREAGRVELWPSQDRGPKNHPGRKAQTLSPPMPSPPHELKPRMSPFLQVTQVCRSSRMEWYWGWGLPAPSMSSSVAPGI